MTRSRRLSFFTVLLLLWVGVAAARSRISRRRRSGSSSPSRPTARSGTAGSGVFSQGSKDRSVVTVSSRSRCTASSSSKSWTEASSVWVAAYKDALVAACNFDTGRIFYAFDAVASAYAEIALDAFASCETSGEGAFGCAYAKASGLAQARATYSAFLEASSSLNNEGCPCLNQVFVDTYASAEAFGEVWAKVSGSVEASVCTSGTSKVSRSSSLSCYATSFAQIWGEAIAEAWIKSDCDASSDSYLCLDKCENKSSCKTCHLSSFAEANAWATAVVQVDAYQHGECHQTTTETYGDIATTTYPRDFTGRADSGGSGPVYTSAECRASANAVSLAEADSSYAYTCVSAFITGCKEGHHTIPQVVRKEAEAVVEIYTKVLAECTTVGQGAVGCAVAEAFTESYAEASAGAFAQAWATARVEQECGCQNSIDDSAFASADEVAKIFAQVEAWTLADTGCISGDQTVNKDIYIDCAANAFAAILSKVDSHHNKQNATAVLAATC
eukprot:jgi/Ulvmu1/7142/UM034_0048.1